jgi:signal transduction histidine kinase
MVLAVLIVNSALTLMNLRRLQANNERVDHANEVLQQLGIVLTSMSDAETGARGYVITGEPAFLAPYQETVATVHNELDKLQRLTADDAERQGQFAVLEQRAQRRLDLLKETIALRGEAGFDEAKSRISQQAGREAMEHVRDQIGRMRQDQRRRLVARQGEAQVSYWTALITSLITAGLGVALVAVGFLYFRRHEDIRDRAAQSLQEANERLEDRVRERTATISDANAALRGEIETRRQAEQQAQLFAEELQRSNRELERFASVASHDLQEPLRKIQAFGDRLQRHSGGQLDEKGQDYLARMLGSAGRMRKLIDDLLTYSRVSTWVLPFVPVNLREVAEEVAGDLDGRLQATEGRIEIGELPTIEAEPVQMRQLLQNLVGNALKFHRPGVPPVVTITSRVLPADAAAAGEVAPAEVCELTIADNGIGFDQVYVDRIFELFQRLHNRHEYEGTGMGLAICRKIVERHGGQIAATSTPGQGTRFLVKLPTTQLPQRMAP